MALPRKCLLDRWPTGQPTACDQTLWQSLLSGYRPTLSLKGLGLRAWDSRSPH